MPLTSYQAASEQEATRFDTPVPPLRGFPGNVEVVVPTGQVLTDADADDLPDGLSRALPLSVT